MGELCRHSSRPGSRPARWWWGTGHPPTEVGVPDGVREVITSASPVFPKRPGQHWVLAAVIGVQFELDVLVDALDQPEITILQALDPAIADRLVAGSATTGPGHRFVHALVRATIFDGFACSRRVNCIGRRARRSPASSTATSMTTSRRWPTTSPAPEQPRAPPPRHMPPGPVTGPPPIWPATRRRTGSPGARPPRGGRWRRGAAAANCSSPSGSARRRAGDAASRQTLLDYAHLARSLGDSRRLARAAVANQPGLFNFFFGPGPGADHRGRGGPRGGAVRATPPSAPGSWRPSAPNTSMPATDL